MLARELFELRDSLRGKGIMFAYCGYVTEPVLTGVGEALKQKLASRDVDTKTTRSVFAVFVEQMQNMIRYSAEQVPSPGGVAEGVPKAELRYGVLTIGQEGGDYVVHAGNLVRQADVEGIRERLTELKAMDGAQLKAFYKKKLKADPDRLGSNAGIGFIEIARRASRPIEFDFMDVDAEYAFFALKACV